ncbi:MAG TPA: zinc ribbon domain-containing protein [Ktedonobacteraceae bacterium]|nr:zinc ribbon domain-containing protein [Ktedonobacteraceae bacterium]
MIFCGQCGLQLAPGTKQCPRCGTVVEEPTVAMEDLPSPDAPTTASPSLLGRSPLQPTPQPASGPPTQAAPPTPNNPQKLVLPPVEETSNYDYNTQVANESTRVANTPNPPIGTSYPDYRQSGGNYPTQAAYPDYGTQPAFQGYAPPGRDYQEPAAPRSSGRVVGLVLILLGLLFILGAVILFALQHNNVIGSSGGGSGAGGGSANTQQAQTVVQQYYNAINQKDFQTAYGLWKANTQSYAAFTNGYKNTQNDALTISDTTVQQDGTVKVTVTVNATEKATSGIKHSTYTGYYIVGQQTDGTWKILDGMLQQQQP